MPIKVNSKENDFALFYRLRSIVYNLNMYGITDLKKDTVFMLDSTPYRVVEYNQKSVGRGGSIVNVKVKNLLDGSVQSKAFKGQDKFEPAEINIKKVQYLYSDDSTCFFMDEETYEQFEVNKDIIGDSIRFMKESDTVKAHLFEGRVINIELPVKIPLQVTDTPDVVKGDTQSTVLKEATLETDTKIQVPIFIKSGDVVIVDTRDGSYVERKK